VRGAASLLLIGDAAVAVVREQVQEGEGGGDGRVCGHLRPLSFGAGVVGLRDLA